MLKLLSISMLFVAALPQLAFAQTVPTTLIAGETSLTGTLPTCYVGRGFSTFQRNGNGSKALISFSEIVDQGLFDLSGQAVLTFSSPTAGDIRFKQTPTFANNVKDPPFSNYVQTYDAANLRLTVNFTIQFPDCNLPVTAVFDHT